MENLKIDANKVRKLIVLLGLVILVIISVILVLLMNPTDNRLKYIYDESQEGNIEIMPLNVSPLFVEYTGRVNQRSIYKAMYLLVNNVVQEYYNEFKGNFNDDTIGKYFDRNTEKIRQDLGITDKAEFIKVINVFKNLNGDKLELEEYIIVPDSFDRTTKGLEFVLLIKYKDNSRIALTLEVLNAKQSTKTPINCSADVDGKYLDYEYEKNTTPVVEIEGRPGKVIN